VTRSTASSSPGTTAKKVKTCVKLPRGVFVVNARGGKVSGRSVCWTRSSLAAGRSADSRWWSARRRAIRATQGSRPPSGVRTRAAPRPRQVQRQRST
jgi:hypothetical protein